MTRWALAAGDFTPHGGMDRANHALARYLATSGRDVHLVAHRVWPDLAALPGVTRPSRAAAVRLAPARRAAAGARRVAGRRAGSAPGARACSRTAATPRWVAPTWVHYLHAAYAPQVAAGVARAAVGRGRAVAAYLAREAETHRAGAGDHLQQRADGGGRARAATASTRRASSVVYYGVDPDAVQRRDRRGAARRAAQRSAWPPTAPVAVFIGALGDRRKGFDVAVRRLAAAVRGRRVGREPGGRRRRRRSGRVGAARRRRRARPRASRFCAFDPTSPACSPRPTCWCIPRATRPTASACTKPSAAACRRSCRPAPASPSGCRDDLRPLTLPEPTAADDLVARLRLWRGDIGGLARARRARPATRSARRTWDRHGGGHRRRSSSAT